MYLCEIFFTVLRKGIYWKFVFICKYNNNKNLIQSFLEKSKLCDKRKADTKCLKHKASQLAIDQGFLTLCLDTS